MPEIECPFPVGSRLVFTPGWDDYVDPINQGYLHGTVHSVQESHACGYDDETGEDLEEELVGWELGVSFDDFHNGHNLGNTLTDNSGWFVLYEFDMDMGYTIALEAGSPIPRIKRARYKAEREYINV